MIKLIYLIQKLKFVISYIKGNEFNETKYLKQVLTDDSIVVDVGSNLGSFIKMIKSINKNTFVHSIEPNLEILNIQKKKLKKLNNIFFHNIAISNKNEFTKFYVTKNPSNSTLNLDLKNPLYHLENTVDIETFTLSKFISENLIDEITILKLDTEGHDLLIIENSIVFLLSKVRIFKIECNFESALKIFSICNSNNLEILGFNNLFHYQNKFFMTDLYILNKNFH